MFQTMNEGIVVFQNGLITFSNNAFKSIIKQINFQNLDIDEDEVDIFEYKLFSIYRQDEILEMPTEKKKKNKQKLKKKKKCNKKKVSSNNIDLQKNKRYSLNDIFDFPEGFLNDKIFKIIYD